jgi:glycosyltransferase involved in cell wall biosynthesis
MPADAPFLSLVIPAHNEESRLPVTLEQVFAFLTLQNYAAEVIVVENGSTDRTLEVAQSFTSRHAPLKVIHMDERGKGLAVKRGMLAARGEFRFFADADFSMPVSEINRFLPPVLPDCDVVIASRETVGAVRYNEPFRRHLSGRIFNALIRLVVLPGLDDTQCGFKCFRARVAEEIFPRQTMPGWSFDVELLYIARRKGYRIKEIGIPWYFNPETKVSLVRDSLRMASDLFAIRRNARRGLYD